jgi:hypothetical protein
MKVDGLAVEYHQTRYALARDHAALLGIKTAEQAIRVRNTHLSNMTHHYSEIRAALDVFDNDYDMGFSETLVNLLEGSYEEQLQALVRMCSLGVIGDYIPAGPVE